MKEGEAAAFDEIYRKYSRKIYSFSLGLLKDRETAKEIVQEVFVCLWEKRDQVDVDLSYENYVFTITYNCIQKFFRKRSIEARVKDYLASHSSGVLENADSSLIYNELLELANRTIEKLPDRRKMVYKMSRQEGMKIRQIASTLNISVRTAESHLFKALKYLKEELEANSLSMMLFYYLFMF